MSRQEELENDYQVAIKAVQSNINYHSSVRPLTEMDKKTAAISLFYLLSICDEAVRMMLKTYTETEDKTDV